MHGETVKSHEMFVSKYLYLLDNCFWV